jgi:hypothetical protein
MVHPEWTNRLRDEGVFIFGRVSHNRGGTMTSGRLRALRRRGRARARVLGLTLAAVAAVPLWAATATATTPLGTQTRVSAMGVDGDATFDGIDASAAYNARANQSLVVWEGTSATGDQEIWGRLVDAQGATVGNQLVISDMGDGSAAFGAADPSAAYNPRTNQYMVVWRGDDNVAPLADGEFEIFAQRLDASGALVGANDQRISDMGTDGLATFGAAEPHVAYNVVSNEYLVVWQGDDDTAPLVDEELEIFAQRLNAGGAETGPNDQRISDTGAEGATAANFDATEPVAVANEANGEYLVVWDADDGTDEKTEIFMQRLTADAAQTGANDVKISDMGPDGVVDFTANAASVAYNSVANEYMVAWEGDDNTAPLVNDEFEVYVQRISAAGAEEGTNDQRVSDMGPAGTVGFTAAQPAVSHDFRANEYLVAWEGVDNAAPLVLGETEIYAQRLSGVGAEIGTDDARVSTTGADGNADLDALDPATVYNSQANEYLIAWQGDSSTDPAADEFEIFVRRHGAAAAPASANAVCVTLPPVAAPTKGDPSKITLTTKQLLINQRIDQAAIRRANGVQNWLEAGVQARDICQGALGAAKFQTGVVTGFTGLPITLAAPSPRPVTVPAAVPGNPNAVKLTTNQILINQRISQAAIRRLNGLKARLDGGLSGGDLANGTLTRPTLATGLQILFAPAPPANPPAKTVTVIAKATPGNPNRVTLSKNQLLINQRISQAAVLRANALIRRLNIGLGSAAIKDATITGADLATGLALATS